MTGSIPLHDFSRDDHTSILFKILPLEVKANYDSSIAHRHNYYEIFLFTKGGGTHEIDFKTLEIESQSLHFVSPGQVHLVDRDLNSHGYVIMFSREFYYLNSGKNEMLFDLPFLSYNTDRPSLKLNDEEYSKCLTVVKKIDEEYSKNGAYMDEALRLYLDILLIECKRMYYQKVPQHVANGTTSSGMRIVREFKVLLEENFRLLHKVSDYADLLYVTPKYLSEILKNVTGRTAVDIIQERIILEAKRLFIHSDLSAKEIAYFLSFDDPSHFSKFFKNNTGFSPNDFRQSLNVIANKAVN